uniref:Uncharacterized protein n=1 Tax=Panagrolaimus sp. PS1159 TaxID=55785 RepID=A0AC35G6P8_9BILA
MAGSNEKLPPGTLCAVCEDTATGNHYNVASCSGCKTFFRRAVVVSFFSIFLRKRYCRFQKCLYAGMNKNAIQNDRDRIGYTKRTRRKDKNAHETNSKSPEKDSSPFISMLNDLHDDSNSEFSETIISPYGPIDGIGDGDDILNPDSPQTMLERLAQLENNFSLLLSRGKIEPYASLGDALAAPSRFTQPINVKITDPIATPEENKDQCQMPFWRSRIIALYIDWAKTFFAFRKLPYADQVALITNHASSYMIMCEAFRTPEHKKDVSPPSFAKIIKQEINDDEIEHASSTLQQQQQSTGASNIPRLKTPPPTATSHSSYFPSNMHTFFDPDLIREGKTCIQTGVRSLVDVPPAVHYPTVGSLSGLTPVMAVMIDYVMKPFRRLKITTTEFATLQAIMFFDPDTDGLDSASQRKVEIIRYDPAEASDRYSAILLRIPTIRKVAAKKNESLQIIDMFNLFSLSNLVKETTLGIRPQGEDVKDVKMLDLSDFNQEYLSQLP